MFPLKNKKIVGYKFGQKTFYNNFHLGVDYADEDDVIYAPFDGKVTKTFGKQGGNTILFKPDKRKELFRFLHCKDQIVTGWVKEGTAIGRVGYSGLVSPPGPKGSHTHLDISKNGKLELNKPSNFLDPEKYDWKGDHKMPQIRTQAKGPSRRIVLEAANATEWKALCAVMGKDPDQPEEKVKDE